MKRRQFIELLGKGSLAMTVIPTFGSVTRPGIRNIYVTALTNGPKHHFFGYYGINPWNKSQSHILGLEVLWQDRMPIAGEKAVIGLADTSTGAFEKVTETSAWNFQQGAMLHWNPLHPNDEIYFNDMVDGDIVTRKVNVNNGKEHIIPRPINALSNNGKYGLSLNYGRLGRMRRVVGYSGIQDPNPDNPAPENDGIFLVDMLSGKTRLIVSIRDVYEMLQKRGIDFRGKHMWFNHVAFNSDDTRLLFLARTPVIDSPNTDGVEHRETGMFTVNIDGSDLFETVPYGADVSHFDWRNEREIVATFKYSSNRRKHYMFEDKSLKFDLLGEGRLDFDGHCVFGPDQQWIATDRKVTMMDPSDKNNYRGHLYIYNVVTKEFIQLVDQDYLQRSNRTGDIRCDFHPRWKKTGDAICFDAIDQRDGTRQLHVVRFES